MSKRKPAPFNVRQTLVVEGGWLQSLWAVDSKVVEGVEFATLSMSDRSLAKALGMNMSERAPLSNCSIFSHMAAVRDAEVDAIIFQSKLEKDPMADSAAAKSLPSRGRAIAFAEAAVPAMISLKIQAFVTHDGQRVDDHTIRIITTPKRGATVTMEAKAENFEWLLMAAQAEWGGAAKVSKRVISDDGEAGLPELAFPCKYQKTDIGKLKIVCSYRQQGVWKKHQRAVDVHINKDNSNFETIVRRCEAEVLDFYKSQHEAGGPRDQEAELTTPAIQM